jgi:hypothetical protein
MDKVLYFGEVVDGYDVPVLNEREVRASAGILFLFAMIAFMNAWLTGSFYLTRIFVIAFLIDFSIRIFVNPKYSPTMILGRFFVRNQQEEYVGAPQKRFAWSIGLILAVTMFYLVVVNNVIGPFNLLICSTCLLLLFFESAFGICIACKIYNLAFKEKAKLCPGNTCEVNVKQRATKISGGQIAVTALFLVAIASVGKLMPLQSQAVGSSAASNADAGGQGQGVGSTLDCKVPDWAVAIGHVDKWKLHNNCNTTGVLPVSASAVAGARQPTVEIIAMAHSPVQSALRPRREWLAKQDGKLRVVEIDAESGEGEQRLQSAGLKGHIPIVILIDGKYRYQRQDGSSTEFVNFPAAAGNPTGFSGTWAAEDVEAVLLGRMK